MRAGKGDTADICPESSDVAFFLLCGMRRHLTPSSMGQQVGCCRNAFLTPAHFPANGQMAQKPGLKLGQPIRYGEGARERRDERREGNEAARELEKRARC